MNEPSSPIDVFEGNFTDFLITQPGSIYLKELQELRKKGWQSQALDSVFFEKRAIADSPGAVIERIWFNNMKKIFRELDDHANIVSTSRLFTFLDIGFCPGGFASYILSRNNSAVGTGISLPLRQSGHEYLLEDHLRQRFNAYFGDLGFYNLFNEHFTLKLRGITLKPLPHTITASESTYDLVILDGKFLWNYTTPDSEAPERWDYDRLMVSQIIIALQSVASGGTIVMKFSRPERYLTATVLYMLDQISSHLELVKPVTMHRTRGSFYAIAKGVGDDWEKKEEYLFKFRLLWYDLSFGGRDAKGRFLLDRGQESDLNFIVSLEDLRCGYMERLIELSEDVWRVQAEALQQLLRRKGIIS